MFKEKDQVQSEFVDKIILKKKVKNINAQVHIEIEMRVNWNVWDNNYKITTPVEHKFFNALQP